MLKTIMRLVFLIILILFFARIIQINSTEIITIYQEFACWLYPNEDNRNAELLKIILTVIGGLGVFFTLYLSYKRAKAGDKAVRLQGEAINKQSEQLELSRKSQIDERFKNAVEHLGNEKEPIILGGIVELHQIAIEEREKYASVVFNILTSFLRTILKANLERTDDFSSTIPQTIIDFIFRGSDYYLYKDFKANLANCNFSGLDINGSNFKYADFSFSIMPMHLTDISFENVKFSRTNFTITRINNVKFRNTDFHDNLFNFCEIKNAEFYESKFLAENFLNCKFFECKFIKTDIYNTKFLLCHFDEVIYANAQLLDINFSGSNFVNSYFAKNDTMSKINFQASGFYSTSFDNECFDCNFSGIRLRYQFDFIQLKDVKENINKSINKTGIIELSASPFLDCKWEKFTQEDYDLVEEDFNSSISKWEEKYKTTETTKQKKNVEIKK